MAASPDFDIKKIANIFYVRKGMIIAAFLVVFSLSAYLALSLPDIYRSSTVILITPQKLPASYVQSPVTSTLEQRVRTISEDILSRTRLEKIVQEFNLYPQLTKMDARVGKLRKNILIDVRRDNLKDVHRDDTFALSFEHTNPEKAMQVAVRLGALFIDGNLQLREQQATATTSFINAEADRLRKELEEQEAGVNLYKAQHRFELPEQLEANLRTLEQLRAQLQGNMLRLSSLQERKGSLEKQLVEAKYMVAEGGRSKDSEGQQGAPAWRSVEDRKLQLEDLLTRYSEKHPDVLRLKKEIQSLEAEAKKQSPTKGSNSTETPMIRNPVQQMLLKQIEDLNLEINSMQAANEVLRNQIASYQGRVDNTPVRAIELAKVSRAYEITLKKYQDLQGKSFDSQLSENMEKSQKGEQFQVMDRANLPQQPVAPDRLRILLVGLAAALAAGFGLAFVRENLDTSFKRGDDFRDYADVPLLATIPAVSTRGSILEQRRSRRMLVLTSGLVLVVGIVSIHLYGTFFF
jgi:polysaccharide chain length determinant protein (PEP-CTERM system associated)